MYTQPQKYLVKFKAIISENTEYLCKYGVIKCDSQISGDEIA